MTDSRAHRRIAFGRGDVAALAAGIAFTIGALVFFVSRTIEQVQRNRAVKSAQVAPADRR